MTFQDGFKVEAVARADEVPDKFVTKAPMTFIATDDENYGGTLRPVIMT